MRLVMMGTGPFAAPTFESLLDSNHDVLLLVTRPAAPVRSRGAAIAQPMRDVAEARGVAIADPPDVNAAEVRTRLAELRPDLMVVCDYGQILSAETLSVAPLGGVNLHGSLLPKYRGAAPVQWAILRGDTETGVSVIHMTPKLDAGPVLTSQSTPIGPEETAEQLEPRLAQLGVQCVHQALRMLEAWDRRSTLGTPQDPALACRAPRLSKSDGAIDWTRPARELVDQVRGLKPWPGTFTIWRRADGQSLRLKVDEVAVDPWDASDARPGQVVVSDGARLVVATGRDGLEIRKIQPAGKRVLDVAEFLRGYPLVVGETLGEP